MLYPSHFTSICIFFISPQLIENFPFWSVLAVKEAWSVYDTTLLTALNSPKAEAEAFNSLIVTTAPLTGNPEALITCPFIVLVLSIARLKEISLPFSVMFVKLYPVGLPVQSIAAGSVLLVYEVTLLAPGKGI